MALPQNTVHIKTKLICFLLAISLLWTAAPFISVGADDGDLGVMSEDKHLESSFVGAQTMVSTNYNMRTSEAGFDMIKDFEGYTPYAEWDYSQWTYGYGSRAEYEGQYISESDAAQLLKDIMYKYENSVNAFAKEYSINFNQNQFDALVSFTYNLGEYYWKISTYENSTIKRMLIDMPTKGYDKDKMVETFCLYCHAGGEFLQGLYNRRKREGQLFCFEDVMAGDINDSNTDYYVLLNVGNSAYLMNGPSSSSGTIKRISRASVLPIIRFNSDRTYGLTVFNGQPGWINAKYLVKLPRNAKVADTTKKDSLLGYDSDGFTYKFDTEKTTAEITSVTNKAGDPDFIIPSFVIRDNTVYTVVSIADKALSGNTIIESIYLPPEIQSIGQDAFKGSAIKNLYYELGSYAERYAVLSGFNAVPYDCARGHIYGAWETLEDPEVQKAKCAVCGYDATRRQIGISVLEYPDKLEYYYDGSSTLEFAPIGLVIRVKYDDDSTQDIVYTDDGKVKCSGFESVKIGNCPITVAYNSFTTTFDVKITQLVMTSISIASKPSKTTYVEGIDLNLSGLSVKGNYNDGSSVKLENYSVSGYDKNKIGTQTVKVTYSGLTATFTVKVNRKSPTGFKVNSNPARMEYYVGDNFDPFGLTLKVTYNNGTSEVIDHTAKLFEELRYSSFSSDVAGKTSVTLNFCGYTRTLSVLIISRDLESVVYELDDTYVSGVAASTKVEDFVKSFDASSRIKLTYNGKELLATDNVPAGAVVRLWYNSDILDERILLVTGDPSGDGVVGLSDYVALYSYIKGSMAHTPVQSDEVWLACADTNGDGVVNLTDLINFKKAILGQIQISPIKYSDQTHKHEEI